jgi:hypothetical protein
MICMPRNVTSQRGSRMISSSRRLRLGDPSYDAPRFPLASQVET